MVPGKENIGNFVVSNGTIRNDLESQNCFRFVLVLPVQFAQKVRDRSLPFLSAGGRLTGIDECCKTGLQSVKGHCHGNKFLSF